MTSMKTDPKRGKFILVGVILILMVGGAIFYSYRERIQEEQAEKNKLGSAREFSNVLSGMSQFRQGLLKYDESKRDLSEYFPATPLGKSIARLVSLRRLNKNDDPERERLHKEITENPTEVMAALESALSKFPRDDIFWAHYEVLRLLKELPVEFSQKREVFARYLLFPMVAGEKITNTLALFAVDFFSDELSDPSELQTLVRDSLTKVHTSSLARSTLLSHLSKRNPAVAKDFDRD